VERPVWIFAYGSLIFRPGFSFIDVRTAFIEGYCRRFWQGSTDHRGVPGAPGRVVTLVADPGARCWGRAYRVSEQEHERVVALLDERERGGYDRVTVEAFFDINRAEGAPVVVYLAAPKNQHYLGEASLAEIAEQVRRSSGPSGSNSDYVISLAACLRELGLSDDHVFDLEAALLATRLANAKEKQSA
jgi:glutathione-specific gamma-glutamylcyclotransferase